MKKLFLLILLLWGGSKFTPVESRPIPLPAFDYSIVLQAQSLFFYTPKSLFIPEYQAVLDYAASQHWAPPSNLIQSGQNMLFSIMISSGMPGDVFKNHLGDGSFNFTGINWYSPGSNNTVRNNGPTYTFEDGITNNAIATTPSYLDQGWSPTNGVNYTLNSNETIIFYKAGAANSSAQDGASDSGSTNMDKVAPYSDATHIQSFANDAGGAFLASGDLNEGLIMYGRLNSSTTFNKKNNNSRLTQARASTAVSTHNFYIGGVNANGVIASTNTLTTYLFWTGGLLSSSQETIFYNGWNNYMALCRSTPTPNTIGNIYNATSFSGTSDFTNNGSTVSASGGELHFSGGAGTFTQSLDLTSVGGISIGATVIGKWGITITFRVPTLTAANTQGIAIGMRSSNSYPGGIAFQDLVLKMSLLTGGTQGVMNVYSNTNHTSVGSASALTIAGGDMVTMFFGRNTTNVTYSATNVTNPMTVTGTPINLYTTSQRKTPNTGHFAIFNLCTNQIDVTGLTVSSTEYYQPSLLIQGDSKAQGFLANTLEDGFAFQIRNGSNPTTVIFGGASDVSADYKSQTDFIINVVRPKTVLICGISNDIRSGISSGTWQSNLSTEISALQAAGINVLLSTGVYETSVSQAAVQTWMNANYSAAMILDYVNTVVTLNVDGIHPDNAGHLTHANALLGSGKIPYTTEMGIPFTHHDRPNNDFKLDPVTMGYFLIALGLIVIVKRRWNYKPNFKR